MLDTRSFISTHLLKRLIDNSLNFFALEKSFVVKDIDKSRQASREVVRECLLENGVKLTPEEIDVLYSDAARGQKVLNYLDFISTCRGQMSQEREKAVGLLYEKIEPRQNADARTSVLLSKFKPDRHPDVKSLGFDPQFVRSNFQESLDLFGRLGGFDLQNGLIKFDEFLEFFDGLSALELDDRRFLAIVNDCFA